MTGSQQPGCSASGEDAGEPLTKPQGAEGLSPRGHRMQHRLHVSPHLPFGSGACVGLDPQDATSLPRSGDAMNEHIGGGR